MMAVPARVPERTCVGCRRKAPKHDLVRFVRAPNGGIALDRSSSGSAPGRGAYVHRDESCIGTAWSKGALTRALRARLAEDELVRLRDEIGKGWA